MGRPAGRTDGGPPRTVTCRTHWAPPCVGSGAGSCVSPVNVVVRLLSPGRSLSPSKHPRGLGENPPPCCSAERLRPLPASPARPRCLAMSPEWPAPFPSVHGVRPCPGDSPGLPLGCTDGSWCHRAPSRPPRSNPFPSSSSWNFVPLCQLQSKFIERLHFGGKVDSGWHRIGRLKVGFGGKRNPCPVPPPDREPGRPGHTCRLAPRPWGQVRPGDAAPLALTRRRGRSVRPRWFPSVPATALCSQQLGPPRGSRGEWRRGSTVPLSTLTPCLVSLRLHPAGSLGPQ